MDQDRRTYQTLVQGKGVDVGPLLGSQQAAERRGAGEPKTLITVGTTRLKKAQDCRTSRPWNQRRVEPAEVHPPLRLQGTWS